MSSLIVQQMARGVKDLRVNPWAQTLTLASVILISLLGGLFLLFVHNLDKELMRTRGEVVFQVYWNLDADMEQVRLQWSEMRTYDYVSDLATYTPGDAVDELSQSLGSSMDLTWVEEEGILPATALVFFTPPEEGHVQWTENLLLRLQSLTGVKEVHYNPLRTDLASSWAHYGKRIIWPLIFFLGLVLALIIGNTIKLAMLEKRDEIHILQLVGARAWYIQLPLVVSGLIHSVAGSTIALVLLKFLQAAAQDVLNFPPLFLRLEFFTLDQCLFMVAAVAVIGMASSRLAVKRLSSPRRAI